MPEKSKAFQADGSGAEFGCLAFFIGIAILLFSFSLGAYFQYREYQKVKNAPAQAAPATPSPP
jgi:hypothetical protein